MRRFITHYLIVPALLALTSTACGDDLSTTTPTDPGSSTPTTDTIPGSINPNGGATHTFTTARSGSVTVTLSTLSPDNTSRSVSVLAPGTARAVRP